MKIKSNAAPQETASPFYEKNREFCQAFEHFVASKNGLIKGKFNAWSYLIYGKITANYAWDLQYKRAIYSSTGSIFSLLYRDEVVLTLAKWTCKDLHTNDASFRIRKRKFFDRLNPRFSSLKHHPTYVIQSKSKETTFLVKILDILEPIFNSEEIYMTQLKNGELTIELRSETAHFDVLERFLEL